MILNPKRKNVNRRRAGNARIYRCQGDKSPAKKLMKPTEQKERK